MERQTSKTGHPGRLDMLATFKAYLARRGLKSTHQRDLIVDVFAGVGEHVRVEDLLRRVKRRDPAVGYATVYRTLRLLVDAGLASVRNFGGDHTRYELRDVPHHDHMICEQCGTILEFTDETIERLQDEITRQHGFLLLRHKHELYGLCAGCQEKAS